MEIKGSKVKIWANEIKGKNGVFYRYKASVSKKTQDGEYINTSLPIKFTKGSGAPDVIENGSTCSFEGFMSVESYKDREGSTRNTPLIVAMKADFGDSGVEADGFQQAADDMPF